ncbi:MAG: alpha/beta hydrolase-fold protein [Candidatus Eremiobacteraeota bacterium]|nr:alpha/beta hydrolase-fold protein [Candidatus Eremiobacteraeota bacterium]
MIGLATVTAAIVALATAAAPASSPDPLQPVRTQFAAARNTLINNFQTINTRSGLAAALRERLDGDAPGAGFSAKPTWMNTADFIEYMTYLAKLDMSLVDQYATGSYHALSAVRGADDTVFKSPADGTMQPLAVYVPRAYDPRKAASLVVFLHGRTASENDIIAQSDVRAAADSTGSVVVAPYARGDSQYVDPAPADVYAALDVVKKAFSIDPRRIYLAGHSMGGYGVFIVGPKHPQNWTGILAASGGMTTETFNAALRGLQGIPVYLVVGSDDPIVPRGYMKQNADLLKKSGIETHYYEQPGGLHAIGTIGAAFARAWREMLARLPGNPPAVDRAIPADAHTMAPDIH